MGYAGHVQRTFTLPLVAAALMVGCGPDPSPTKGGEPTAAEKQARVELVRANSGMNDLELAHLCPALYPADVLKDPKKYGFDNAKATTKASAASLALAEKAGCGNPVPIKSGSKSR